MSTLHNTGRRLLAWARSHALLLVAIGLALAFVVLVFVSTYRLYDERRAQTVALQRVTVDFCNRGNMLRSALRDYLHQTIVILPVPPGADPATAATIGARNDAAQAALDRGDRSFAPVDCAALARQLKGHS